MVGIRSDQMADAARLHGGADPGGRRAVLNEGTPKKTLQGVWVVVCSSPGGGAELGRIVTAPPPLLRSSWCLVE
ncbi:hypothetical protein HYQ46_010688 [Verticillium longisporum]|nr:hypothetical protein HYQ46_010688 [Verticillium longisporum]